MPMYCFSSPDGVTIERHFHHDDIPEVVMEGKVKYARNVVAEHGGFEASHAGWPIKSDAAGIHPSQETEMREYLRKRGADCEFTRDGRAVFTSRAHRRQVLKVMNYIDHTSYTGY